MLLAAGSFVSMRLFCSLPQTILDTRLTVQAAPPVVHSDSVRIVRVIKRSLSSDTLPYSALAGDQETWHNRHGSLLQENITQQIHG